VKREITHAIVRNECSADHPEHDPASLAALPPGQNRRAGVFAPVVGWAFDAVGIPAEATLDWAVLGVAAFNLLKLFPRDVVGEHYDRLFRK
jgi:hypothetical protein